MNPRLSGFFFVLFPWGFTYISRNSAVDFIGSLFSPFISLHKLVCLPFIAKIWLPFHNVQTVCLGATRHPKQWYRGSFLGDKGDQGLNLTTRLRAVPRLRMRGSKLCFAIRLHDVAPEWAPGTSAMHLTGLAIGSCYWFHKNRFLHSLREIYYCVGSLRTTRLRGSRLWSFKSTFSNLDLRTPWSKILILQSIAGQEIVFYGSMFVKPLVVLP